MDGRKQEILKSDLKNSKYFNKRVVYFILLVILFSVLVCFVPMIFDNNSNDVSLVGVTDNILLNNKILILFMLIFYHIFKYVSIIFCIFFDV